jgi:hypothetical protein
MAEQEVYRSFSVDCEPILGGPSMRGRRAIFVIIIIIIIISYVV